MAAVHFSNCTANLNQSRLNLALTGSRTTATTNITIPLKSNAATLSLKSCHFGSVHVTSHMDNSIEPSSSFSPQPESPLRIGIIGFGNFGQFIGHAFKKHGHNVLATSRSDYSEYCQKHGFEFFSDIDRLCEAQPDVVLLSSSILSTENIVRGIPFHKLKPGTIFADVLSVKRFPKNLFMEVLPEDFGILCTHPMFGPQTAKDSWEGSCFVYDRVRIVKNSIQDRKCSQFLSIFENEGCRMVEMSCEEHDRHAAGSQFVTHTVGRILSDMNLESTPIDTKGYERLLEMTNIYSNHHYDLYYGLFAYNMHAKEQIENLERAFDSVKQKLFGRLHENLRKQMVETASTENSINEVKSTTYFLPITENVRDLSTFNVIPSQVNWDGPLSPKQKVHA